MEIGAVDAGDKADVSVGVSTFKPKSLDLIERVASGKLRRVILTKHGRPAATARQTALWPSAGISG